MKKTTRHELIRTLIKKHRVDTQEELLALLQAEGAQVTQATVSRDVRELGIVKAKGPQGDVYYQLIDKQVGSNPKQVAIEQLRETIVDNVSEISHVEFLVVLQTKLGSADMVAAVLDAIAFSDVAGTLAGTDTVVIIGKSKQVAEEIAQRLLAFQLN